MPSKYGPPTHRQSDPADPVFDDLQSFSWTSAVTGALATLTFGAVIVAVAAIILLEEPADPAPESAATPSSLAWLAATTVAQPDRGAAGAGTVATDTDTDSDSDSGAGESASAAADPAALRATQPTMPPGLAVSPDGDGVVVRVDASGVITMAGAVPDLETIQHLEALFADSDLAGDATTAELVVEEGAPQPTGKIVIDNNLLFPIGGDSLRSAGVDFLNELAVAFEDEPTWALTVTVHTDDTGGPEHNAELSAERADAVVAALAEAGVSDQAMTAVGAGMEFPVGDNRTVVGRNQNRRVEIQIITAL